MSRICRGVGVQRFGCTGERLGPQLAANAVFVHGLALPLSMSELGHAQTSAHAPATSAHPSKADIAVLLRHVRFVPKSDVTPRQREAAINRLGGEQPRLSQAARSATSRRTAL